MSTQDLAGILPLVLIVLVFWFLVIRPSRKRQQEMGRVQSSLDVGTEVMLGSGIYGTVVAVADDTLELQISPGTSVKVARQAVVRVVDNHATSEPEPTNQDSSKVVDEQ